MTNTYHLSLDNTHSGGFKGARVILQVNKYGFIRTVTAVFGSIGNPNR